MKKSKSKKFTTELYGEVNVYNKIYVNGLVNTIIEGKPFGKLTFDEDYPVDQLTVDDVEFFIDTMRI